LFKAQVSDNGACKIIEETVIEYENNFKFCTVGNKKVVAHFGEDLLIRT
jgi:hypothetical protein